MTSSGRPRKACGTCKAQKIGCTGERPVCKRCARLKHSCVYGNDPQPARGNHAASRTFRPASHIPSRRQQATHSALPITPDLPPTLTAPSATPSEAQYLGIPNDLLLTLLEVYYENVYNAKLLLHKRLFLASLTAGTIRPHVVLSVCAFAANFYRDSNGEASLKNHGFMTEWAQRAGKLVFQEAEELYEDNIVTFCNLTLFWLGQGSWRLAYLHKANADHLLHIIGLGSAAKARDDSLESEIRRRRLWACHLMNCHDAGKVPFVKPLADLKTIPLPWPDDEFDAGLHKCPPTFLESEQSNSSVYAELVRALTFWHSVVLLIKSSENGFSEQLTSIHALDDQMSSWWQRLPAALKLNCLNIQMVPEELLAKVLLLNVVYHQSLCALHASIVPLFSWIGRAGDWFTARQLSAQIAFDHACEVSTLITSVLSSSSKLSALPGFIAYAAYCGCAIQLPFLWCTNNEVKEMVQSNVRSNVKVIHTLATYWNFAGVLSAYVRYLYDVHKKHPTVLEDEPKRADAKRLASFQANAEHTRTSILEFLGILRSQNDGYAKSGEECYPPTNAHLEIEVNSSQPAASEVEDTSTIQAHPLASDVRGRHTARRTLDLVSTHWQNNDGQQGPPYRPHYTSFLGLQHPDQLTAEEPLDDVFNPFDLETVELFPEGDVSGLAPLDFGEFGVDLFNAEELTAST